MQPYFRMIVATAAILTPAAVIGDVGDTQPAWVDITYTVVNNTTTPSPEGRDLRVESEVPEGIMSASCDAHAYHTILKDTTKDIPCQVASGETHTLTYTVNTGPHELHYGTADWNCDSGQTMQLTFTGSGSDVTYSPSCIGSATNDDTDDDTD